MKYFLSLVSILYFCLLLAAVPSYGNTTTTATLPKPGIEGRTTWRVLYTVGRKNYLGFITMNVNGNKVTGRIDSVSPHTGAYELSGLVTINGEIALNSTNKIASSKKTFRHNAQPYNFTGQLKSDGLSIDGKVEGVTGSGKFLAMKFIADTRPPHPDGLFLMEYSRNHPPEVSIETCRSLFGWIAEQSNVQATNRTKIPTQSYSPQFYEFFGIPYDQCAYEERYIYNKLTINCSNQLRNSGTVDDARLLARYNKNANPLYNLMLLNGSSGYPIFPKQHPSYSSQPNYRDFEKYFHFIGLRDGNSLMDQRITSLEKRNILSPADQDNIESLATELTAKPSRKHPKLTQIAATDLSSFKQRLAHLRKRIEHQHTQTALESLAVTAGQQLSSNPDPNDKQDVIVHFLGAAQACAGLPNKTPGRTKCIEHCTYSAKREPSLTSLNDDLWRRWMSCEDLHDTAFGLNNESYPVQRNEYAWGYNENDRRWYGGWVTDFDGGKIQLRHVRKEHQWYPFKDVKKFTREGLVEVNLAGKGTYYQADITGTDLFKNVVVRYTGRIPNRDNLDSIDITLRKSDGVDNDMDKVSVEFLRTYDNIEKERQTRSTAAQQNISPTCSPSPAKYQGQQYGQVLHSLETSCDYTFSKTEQIFMAGLAQSLLHGCGYPQDPESRRTLQTFLTSSLIVAAIGGTDYSNPDIGKSVPNSMASQIAYAAGTKAYEQIGCSQAGKLISQGMVKYLKKSTSKESGGMYFVDGCVHHYGGQWLKSKCQCVADVGRAIFPNIHKSEFDPGKIRAIIKGNPLLSIQMIGQCGVMDY